MESLRGHINSFVFGEAEMSLMCREEGALTTKSSAHEIDYMNLGPQVPFLQMLQGAMQTENKTEIEDEEALGKLYPPDSNLQLLFHLQNHCNLMVKMETSLPTDQQLDSCITHASESQSTTKGTTLAKRTAPKKRKRTRAPSTTKKVEEVESQRMTHIAVERNRRKLMNSHLNDLRSIMPSSFIQRGDQASVIGGAIDFVKELEQLHLSLQAEKRMREAAATSSSTASSPCTSIDDNTCDAAATLDGFFISPQYRSYSEFQQQRASRRCNGTVKEEGEVEEQEEEGMGMVDVEATVVQGHVNLKVAGRRRKIGQLVRVIAAMEELRLSVLHLNITSLDSCSILYSLNLKMEEECKLGSADDIATAVHQIFSYVSACR